ncbi:MAG: cysteine hydrolase [Planctomycetota bacterium]|nr:cysteine hydrolase [Planctomycetota bacterium]MEE2895908.1 cysteine hydrolase [Planctomycetota bacterium]
MTEIDPASTALLLIGFQRDYFDPDGILYGVVEEQLRSNDTLANTLRLIDACKDTEMTMVRTPLVFSEDYGELENPIGILKTIREVEAFKAGTRGAETIDAITAYGDRIDEIRGKLGFNAFAHTDLESMLRERGIGSVVIAGCVTSICINATALHAFEAGFDVTVLSDCTSSRTGVEQEFFCETVFPLFATVRTTADFIAEATAR